ncbi:uncharacterized protein Fot_47577 [Forsythia ovata]|uniref:Uncharacterized protein n=1 Tax=Forsythia ovata TaxID=205694 RepID=A0ABD1QQS0_9LAMI
MAKIWCHPRPFSSQLLPGSRRVHVFRCCSSAPNDKNRETQTPRLLKVAVSGVTELLRLFSFTGGGRSISVDKDRRDDIPVSSIDDVLSTIKSDYEKAYFVTGLFTSAIYANDCTFEDPTIKFRGKELYSRNLSLLVPFFEDPSIQLKKIEKPNQFFIEEIVASLNSIMLSCTNSAVIFEKSIISNFGMENLKKLLTVFAMFSLKFWTYHCVWYLDKKISN